MKLLVFASGKGSNFNALLDASKKGLISSKIGGLICDKNCPAEEIATSNLIPVTILRPKDFVSKDEYISTLIKTVKQYAPDYILLAGYMRIIPTELIEEYPLKIINIHPSLLPAFKGKDAILQAWQAGVKETGVTLHFVNDKLDQGAILAQEKIVLTGTIQELESKIHNVEHTLYVNTVKELTEKPFDTLVVSKCLLGENCRYDGKSKLSSRICKLVENFNGKVIRVCPELDAGFGVPRPASDIINGRFITKEGKDLTDLLIDFTKRFIAKKLSSSKKILAVLKDRSPSCGKNNTQGVFTDTLIKEFSGKMFIVTEEEL